jgi:hypothetical protein
MTREPEYVELEDTFGDLSWIHPATTFEQEFLRVCGRKKYHSKSEVKKVKAIYNNRVKFPQPYIERLWEWARKQNKYRAIISVSDLVSAIRNPDNLSKYYKEAGAQTSEEKRVGYDDTIDW